MKKIKCIECGEELEELEATTYMALNHLGIISDYTSVLCKKCLKKKHDNPQF